MIPILFNAFEEFMLDLEADGLAPRTREWYREQLRGLLKAHSARRLDQFDHALLRDFVLALRRRAGSPHTVRGRVSGLHRFWTWAAARYGVPNPMAGIKRPRMPEPKVKAVAPEDILAMFKAAPATRLGFRDRALLIFLADTGVRAAGVRNLRLTDVDIKRRRAIIRDEKNRRARTVPFSPLTATLLRDWMTRLPIGVEYLFCTDEGGQLKYAGLRQILRRLAKRAGIEGRYNAHSFRHFMAREYLTNGGDLATAARILGHRSIKTTTDYYTVYNDDEVQDRHDQHSPIKSIFNPSKRNVKRDQNDLKI